MPDSDDYVALEGGDASEPDGPPVSTPVSGESDEPPATRTTSSRQVSLGIRTLISSAVILALVAGVAVMTWLYLGERDKVEAQQSQVANYQHAEQIALDYAVNAATMNFQDLNTWKTKLVNGTTPALNDKLTKAAGSMQQILVPLEWNSTAQPLVAKVRSDTNGMYVIDTFVSVLTKTTQAPDNLQSTATYSITIDSNNGWQISDVGGIGAVAGAK
ncbi:MAG: Mce-associated rane protein [Mycobacterium sp.]|nr:Mce-associated rane protein [Mycobacterium sp.]